MGARRNFFTGVGANPLLLTTAKYISRIVLYYLVLILVIRLQVKNPEGGGANAPSCPTFRAPVKSFLLRRSLSRLLSFVKIRLQIEAKNYNIICEIFKSNYF